MPINWVSLQNNIEQYLQRGSGDTTRTPEKTANAIENFYITEVRTNGRDQYGNSVVNLPSGPLATSLSVQFKVNLGLEPPSINLQDMYENRILQLFGRLKTPPPIPYGGFGMDKIPTKPASRLPAVPFSLSMPPLPGNPQKKLSLSIPKVPSASTPILNEDTLLKTTLASVNVKEPEIPNPDAVRSKIKKVISATKLKDFSVNIPSVPVDKNLIKLNAVGVNGVIFLWLGATMGVVIPPPGFASVATNLIVSPGAITPMKVALGGSKFSSEVVSALKRHSKTITGLTTGVTPSGSPIVAPWVGIS